MVDDCPSREVLDRMLAETLPEDQLNVIRTHLGNCEACRETLDELTRFDRLFSHTGQEGQARAHRAVDTAQDIPEIPGFSQLTLLGQGGHGVVFQAVNEKLGRPVAIKLLKNRLGVTPKERERFRVNALAMARLRHPNILSLYAIGEVDGQPYLEMELMPVGGLDRFSPGSLSSPKDVAKILQGIALGIEHAHEHGVLHRDLKPANILLEPMSQAGPNPSLGEFQPKVADFGLAKLLDGQDLGTPSVAILGTPAYMAPEMAFGQTERVGKATDIYGVGAIGYELLTGFPPFQGATPFDSLVRVREEEPVPPRSLRRDIPRDLETIILKSLDKDPARRYGTAGQMAEDLGRFLEGKPVHARPLGKLTKAWRLAKRYPVVSGLSGFLAAVVIGSVAALATLYVGALEKQRKLDARLEIARGALKQAAKITEERFWFPQTIRPEDKEKVLALYRFHETMLDEFVEDGDATYDCAYAMLQLAGMMEKFKDLKLAGELSNKPRIALGELAQKHPDKGKYWHGYGEANIQYYCYTEPFVGKEVAFPYYMKAVEIGRELVRKHPKSTHYRNTLNAFERPMVRYLWEEGRLAEAMEIQKRIMQTSRDLLTESPSDVVRHAYFCVAAAAYVQLICEGSADPKAALSILHEVEEATKQSTKKLEKRLNEIVDHADIFMTQASVKNYIGDIKGVNISIHEGLEWLNELRKENPGYEKLASYYFGLKFTELSLLFINDSKSVNLSKKVLVEELEELVRKYPDASSYPNSLAHVLCMNDASTGSVRDPERAISLLQPLLAKNTSDSSLLLSYAIALSEAGKHGEALEWVREKTPKREFKGLHWELYFPLLRVKCLWSLGQKKEALEEYGRLTEAMKNDCLVPLEIQWYRKKLDRLIKEEKPIENR